jgi:RIO-like serine/threonine protein kinase
VLELDGVRFAVKDYRARPAWVRWTVGRWSLGREERAYAALAGTAGVPALAGRPDPLVLVTHYVDGKSLASWDRRDPLPERFFVRLKETLQRIHECGVVQGDLHHRDVLIGPAGEPWLVDFSTSMTGGPAGLPTRRWLWRLLARLDRRAVLKLQERFAPGTLSAEERDEIERAPWIYRLVRGARRRLRSG